MFGALTRSFGLTFSLLLLASTGTVQHAGAQTIRSREANFRVVTVAEGLETPWSMAWLPNGDMLVTERPGLLRVIRDGTLDSDPVPGVPTVHAQGQGGLLDVVLHPDFGSNQLIYLSYSKTGAQRGQSTTAVARARFDGSRLHDLEEIFEAEAWGERNGHYGSPARLRRGRIPLHHRRGPASAVERRLGGACRPGPCRAPGVDRPAER